MKTTVHITKNKRIVTEPMKHGAGVYVAIQIRNMRQEWVATDSFAIDESAAGALIFGMEQAFAAMGMTPLHGSNPVRTDILANCG